MGPLTGGPLTGGPRPEGWELALADAVEAARTRAFVWGHHDCATWAAEVRRAMTGIDAAAAWRGRYRTKTGAARALARLGFRSLAEGVTAKLGAPLATVLLAQRGDIVMDGMSGAIGVCIGPVALFLSPDGLTEKALSACQRAWRV